MIQADDLLQVKGSFDTQSFMNHGSMLRNGRMELWGNFNQGGYGASFASSGNFIIAFMGSGQRAYFEDDESSVFANIDPDHDSVRIVDYPMILEDNLSFRIGRGILTGLQDALGISQLSAAASALLAELGISLVASAVIMPAMVVSVIGVIMGIIGAVSSAFTAVAAAGGIYSTAMGKGNKYDNAEDYAHDATMLVVSMLTIWGSVAAIKKNIALYKSATQNLAGRTTRPTVSEVVGSSKSAKMISSLDDFLDYTKGFLDDDALQYAKEVLGNDADDTAKLKKVAQLIEDGSGKIGKKLSKEELKAGLDALWDDGGVEGALAAIERCFKGGFQYLNNPLDNMKASRDIVKNPDTVYGYSPNPNSSSIGEYADVINWTDPIEVEKATLRREAYHSKNDNISEIVTKMKSNGCSKEEMARAANKQRNLNRLNDYINDPEGLARVKKRNLSSYGNEEGPTADYLFNKYGSWDKVIEKSMGANPGMDACCGLYDKYFHLYN